ncbi:hypothetical protein NQ176_g5671 [Zarea fungicola]|uniref:Uncharacterized protein n=1 Tax=Zarea fungicola TaxID=93591 RepID=A0ACC1N957_9HYPO|nr:hypothetical protein NQ176_g5671 [Lecanicillium fungicola]
MADQITKPAETSDLELAVHEAKDDVSVRSGRGKEFSSPIIDEEAERSYLRKLDTWLLPFLSMMYFFNSVDRSNVANAKTDHMDTDLGFKGNEYRYFNPCSLSQRDWAQQLIIFLVSSSSCSTFHSVASICPPTCSPKSSLANGPYPP